ncbi:MAG: gluconate 2-dehydrogenase subunit 3 family protein [bacterium]
MSGKSAKNVREPRPLVKKSGGLLSRKMFINTSIAGVAALHIRPLRHLGIQVQKENGILGEKGQKVMKVVQEILFPADDNGPGAADIHAIEYLEWVLADEEKDPEEIRYIIKGIGWLNEVSRESLGKDFDELERKEQEYIIAVISAEQWGESWLSVILTLIFEALLCDPLYPGNPEGIGWKWLDHDPGKPRPGRELIYPRVLTTIRVRKE